MDGSSSTVIVMPVLTLIALSAGMALPFLAASRRAPIEYLYVPCARGCHRGHPAQTRHRVHEVPIVKKTAKWIYYTSGTWDRAQAVVSPGRISRQDFETDTRGRESCPAANRGLRCAPPGDPWGHGPSGEDRCHHGYPAGVIPVPGDRPRPGLAGRLFSPPARPRKPACTARIARTPTRLPGKHHPSRTCAARWPTLTPTGAAPLSSSSKRAAGTRRRFGNVPTWLPGAVCAGHERSAPAVGHAAPDPARFSARPTTWPTRWAAWHCGTGPGANL